MADKEPKFDLFIANHVFPDAEAIFSCTTKSVSEVKDDALVVLDTNALLVPYTVGKEGLSKIRDTYTTLKKEGRLFVPGQVAREFAKNRSIKLAELSHQFNQKMNDASAPKKRHYPLLESFPEYEALVELETQVEDLVKKYRKNVKTVLALIQDWSWNDPVSTMYSELFSENVVVDLPISSEKEEDEEKEKILQDLRNRKTHSLPPGYKDGSKDDEGIGDFLIWRTILKIANDKKKHLIFVSGDEKADWWHRSNGQPLYPRYELVNEFQRSSDGNSFHIMSFASFLELFGASEGIVNEVETVESELNADDKTVGEFMRAWKEFQEALYIRFFDEFPGVKIKFPRSRNSLRKVVEMLGEQQVVDNSFVFETQRVRTFRNKLLHDTTNYSTQEVREFTALVSRLLSDIQTL